MRTLFLALALLATSAHAKPPVTWSAACSTGVLNLATGGCFNASASVDWGSVGGTLTDQSDLVAALDQKAYVGGYSFSRLLITDPSGDITTSPSIGIGADIGGGLQAYVTFVPPNDAGDVYQRIQAFETEINPDGVTTAQSHPSGFAADIHYDRSHTGGDLDGGLTGASFSTSHEGAGDIPNITGVYDNLSLGDDVTGGTSGNAFMFNGNMRVGTGHTVTDLYAMNMGLNSLGTIQNFHLWNVGGAFDVTGNVFADGWDYSGTVGGNFNGFRRGVSGTVTGSAVVGTLIFNADAQDFNGLIIQGQGNTTNGATGLRIQTGNMLNNGYPATSISADSPVQIGANAPIINNQTFQSVNNINSVTNVPNGSPSTGTDVVANSFASVLFADDDVALGPIGLGWSAVGYVGQVGVTAGHTVDEVNMSIAGASFPVESTGGEVTTFNLYRGVGLLNGGGSLVVPHINGLKLDSTLCSGATVDCHGVNILDPLADNNFAGKVQIGGAVSEANVGLSLKDGHVKTTQTAATTAAPHANAGTGATCSLARGTDTNGTISLTTGSASWAAGTQCTVTFQNAFNIAPRCVFSASGTESDSAGANAALASANAYVSATTTTLLVKFANADTAATSYEWSYHCEESE